MIRFAFAAAAALIAVPALAQDAPVAFNGPFIGAHAGWQEDRLSQSQTGVNGSNSKVSGFAYGAQVGYDFRLGEAAVLGAEVGIGGRTGSALFNNFDATQGRTINATARLGYLVTPQGLVYARGGYSNARFNLEDNLVKISENRDGYTVGGGYEQMLGTNVSARLQYDYSNYGSDEIFTSTLTNFKYSRHAVTAGVNFRF